MADRRTERRAMTEEDYDELMRLRERFLAANDEEKVGEGRDQRAMGLGELQENLPALYNSRFKFTGKNAEEFLSKFRHACEAMKVTRIFYEDYGLHKPNMNDPTYPTWSADDSRAFRLLERHLDSDIWPGQHYVMGQIRLHVKYLTCLIELCCVALFAQLQRYSRRWKTSKWDPMTH